MEHKNTVLKGSSRLPLGKCLGEVDGDERITISVVFKPVVRAIAPEKGKAAMTRDAFEALHGADPVAVGKLKEFAADHGLIVVEESMSRRTVRLEGTVKALSSAFGAQLEKYEHNGHEYRARTGSIHVPVELADSIEAVLGLDNRRQARKRFKRHAAANVSYTPRQVAQLYNFPLDVNGAGQTIGILELGGGYKAADLKKYFASLKLPLPNVVSVSVDKGTNAPTTPDSADGEVLLDIEVAGAVAPGAKIVVYFAPNTDQGFFDALTTAIHDKTHKPSVISISWGGAEMNWTSQAMTAFDSAAQDAAALGVTICAASGDNGSSDGADDGTNNVDFPASSPNVLACGGTNLQSSKGAITSETVWNDGADGGAGGGGFSVQFPLPTYQQLHKVTPPTGLGRGVPDVCGDADPETGYQVLVDGQAMVIGGTSAVAPLWSGLIALLNQKLGKPLGFLQPHLYELSSTSGALRDITKGSNGAYSATKGWDAASGLGSPSGQNLLKALTTLVNSESTRD